MPLPAEHYETVTWESWIEASRMDLDPAWFDRQIISVNSALKAKGWQPIEVVYVKERTTWLRRNFTFKVRGQRLPVSVFRNALVEVANCIF